MIVWLASFPRSGNTLLRIILNSVFGLPTSTIYSGPKEGVNPVYDEMNRLIGGVEPSGSLAELQASHQVHFVKTHEIASPDDRNPAVYVLRDGRDALVSYVHFSRAYEPADSRLSFDQSLELLIRSQDHFGGWSRHVTAWSERTAPTSIVRYQELLDRPVETVIDAFKKIEVVLPNASGGMPDFEELKRAIPEFFRKGQSGAWKTEMTAELQELFWSLHGEVMERLDYARSVQPGKSVTDRGAERHVGP
jgi:hypothetical protein